MRVAVRPLSNYDALGLWDSTRDVHLILLADRLNLGQQLATAAHLAQRLQRAAPDAGVEFGVGEVTASSPTFAGRELVDLMDRRTLQLDDVAAVLHHLFPSTSEAPPPWHTSGTAR